MGFGSAAMLGVKVGKPERTAVALVGDGGFCAGNSSVIATAMEANIAGVWIVMDNSAFGVIAGLEQAKYDNTFGCTFTRNGEPYNIRLRCHRAGSWRKTESTSKLPTNLAQP